MEQDFYRDIENLRGFKVKFVSATNTRGARVSILDLRNNKRKVVYFNYETDTRGTALKYLNEIGIKILYSFETEKEYYLLTNDFQTDLK